MTNKNTKSLIILSLFCTQVAANPSEKDNENLLETIQIRGFHDSVVKSLSYKRLNDQISDTISAQEIGKFPDKNVAEALQRITGISLSRVQGEGERIGVRGTTPEQNRTFLNGQYLASADWWISSQPNRGFNFTLLPADIVSSLEVYKTPQANQDEGSLGGSINIKTLDPLYTDNDLALISTQLQYNDLSNEFDPQISTVFNWKNNNQDLALLFTASRLKRSLRRDGLESWGWHERSFNRVGENQYTSSNDGQADLKNIWTPGGGGSAVFQQQRILTTLTSGVSYILNPHWQFKSHLLYSQLEADNSNQNFLWQPAIVLNNSGTLTNPKFIDNTLVYGEYGKLDDAEFNTSMEAIWRKSQIDTSSIQLELSQSIPRWQNQFRFGFTHGGGGTSEDFTSQFSANTDYSVSTEQHKNIIANYTVSPLDAAQWRLTEARKDAQDATDSLIYLQADFNYELIHTALSDLQFGFKLKQHNREFSRLRSLDGGLDGLSGAINTNLSEHPDAFVDNYLSQIGNHETLKLYSFVDISSLSQVFSPLPFKQEVETASRFDIEEQSLAGYLKLLLEGNDYRANIGVRIVNTWQDASAFKQTDSQNSNGFQWLTDEKSYTDILPSANVKFDLDGDLIARFSVARVMSRAQFHHLMPSTNYNVTQAQGQGGNPNLDPYRATQFDAGLEWYFEESALASLAIFNKDVESFIEFKRQLENHEGIIMSIDRPINGNGGSVRGIELSYQQHLFNGFGVIANYTFVDGSRTQHLTDTSALIPGTSKHSFNVTSYYENSWLSIRFAYNYRTKFATGIGEVTMDNYGQLDGNITFSINDKTDLVFEFINLNNEIAYTYERNQYAPTGVYANGRRFYFGARYQF
ncbi:TonB-dependent receptor [Pseudoalteromonas sp. MTN2-4]|uniref:TonB-dependent receptor n=1 Tax=Pseudoalteromonas sp. MTN2-4 TaxID=3056555 RepID=UPI0036F39DE1